MATARKKKASPAQLAARARFAAAAKAGTLRKGSKLKKNPVKKSALRTTPARKKNPSRSQRASTQLVRTRNPVKRKRAIPYESTGKRGTKFSYVVRDMDQAQDIAQFGEKKKAVEYARAYADRWDHQMAVRSI